MNQKFDPYYKWLGIPPKDQPPNHYRLLGIEVFEADREVIDAASNRLMAYLHELASGDDEGHSQRLLNEISTARTTLLNKSDKQEYDIQLRGKIKTAVVVVPTPAQQPPPTQKRLPRAEPLPPAPPKVSCPRCNGPKLSEAQVCPNCSHDPQSASVKDSPTTTADFPGIKTERKKSKSKPKPKSDRDSQVFDTLAALQSEPMQSSPSGSSINIPVGDLDFKDKPKKVARSKNPKNTPTGKQPPKSPQVEVKPTPANPTAVVVPQIVESPQSPPPVRPQQPQVQPSAKHSQPLPIPVPSESDSVAATTTGISEVGITDNVADELSDALSAGTTSKVAPLVWIAGGIVLAAIVVTVIILVTSNNTPPPLPPLPPQSPQLPTTVLVISWPTADRQGAELLVDGEAVELPAESLFEVPIEPGQRHLELHRGGFETINAFLTAAKGKKNRFLPEWVAAGVEPNVPTPNPPVPPNPKPPTPPSPYTPDVDEPPTFTMGKLRELGESSGVARSSLPDHYWTHNDSGGDHALYLIHQGEIVSIMRLTGRNLDWEDVASAEIEGKRYLYAADTGDNSQQRDAVEQIYTIYVVAEPDLSGPNVPGRFSVRSDRVVQFQYADGKHDCEGIAVRRDGSIVLVTKNRSGGPAYVYSLNSPFGREETEYQETTTRKATINIPMVTGLAISPKFDRIAILTIENILEYNLGRDVSTAFEMPARKTALPDGVTKGEAICYDETGRRWILTSEGFNHPVWSVPIR
jgi:hypothetical protein